MKKTLCSRNALSCTLGWKNIIMLVDVNQSDGICSTVELLLENIRVKSDELARKLRVYSFSRALM